MSTYSFPFASFSQSPGTPFVAPGQLYNEIAVLIPVFLMSVTVDEPVSHVNITFINALSTEQQDILANIIAAHIPTPVEDDVAVQIKKQSSPANFTTSGITASEIRRGLLLAPANANSVVPLPSPQSVAAVFPNMTFNDAFDFTIINQPGLTTTLVLTAVAAGVTIIGDPTIPVGISARFTLRFIDSGNYTVYRIA